MTGRSARGDIATFLAIFLPLTAFAEWLLIGLGATPGPGIAFIMWTVGLAALATAKLRAIPLEEFGWRWGPWKYHALAVALPLAYCLVAYVGAALLGFAGFARHDRLVDFAASAGFGELSLPSGLVAALFLTVVGGASSAMIRALGEEIGWRGFLAPRATMAFGFVIGSLLSGILWAGWHLPALFAGPYNGGGAQGWEAACFVVTVVAMTGTFVWIRLASGSLWPAATLHAAHNLIVQSIFDPLATREGAITMTGEFGVVFAAVVLVFSLPFWALGQRLWTQRRADF